METPAISIKIKGLEAINALTSKGQLLGSAKIKGLALCPASAMKVTEIEGIKLSSGKGVLIKSMELEGSGLVATKKGLVLKTAQYQGACGTTKCPVIIGKSAVGATSAQGAAVGATSAKGALAAKGLAASKSAAGSAASTAWCSGKSVGWGLGLGGFGPFVVLGALGLAATGVYLYMRNRAQNDVAELDELESVPT